MSSFWTGGMKAISTSAISGSQRSVEDREDGYSGPGSESIPLSWRKPGNS